MSSTIKDVTTKRFFARGTQTGRASGKRARYSAAIILAGAWLLLLFLAAALADLLPIPAPDAPVGPASVAPFSSSSYPLGTDNIGRDVLARVLHGIRISLAVGLGATGIAAVLGVTLGLTAAYFGGWYERLINVATDAMLAFPPLLLLLALASIVRPGMQTLIISLGFLFAPPFARLTKASTAVQLRRDYITAARSLGAGHLRILLRELLPNVIQPVISYAVVVVALIIIVEGSLSFLGYGVPPPEPSWGSMIAAGKDNIYTAPYLLMVPSMMIFLTVFSFNAVGEYLRTKLSAGKAD